MSPCHQAGCHPTFPLSYSTVAKEVIAVHHSQLVQEELYGALAPSLLWTLALRRTQTWKLVNSAVSTWTLGHMLAGKDSYLLQQVSDELLMATTRLAALSNVRGRHYLLTQAEVFTVHRCQTNSFMLTLADNSFLVYVLGTVFFSSEAQSVDNEEAKTKLLLKIVNVSRNIWVRFELITDTSVLSHMLAKKLQYQNSKKEKPENTNKFVFQL